MKFNRSDSPILTRLNRALQRLGNFLALVNPKSEIPNRSLPTPRNSA